MSNLEAKYIGNGLYQVFVDGKETGAVEYGTEDFSDEKFECECPRCGFKFNR